MQASPKIRSDQSPCVIVSADQLQLRSRARGRRDRTRIGPAPTSHHRACPIRSGATFGQLRAQFCFGFDFMVPSARIVTAIFAEVVSL